MFGTGLGEARPRVGSAHSGQFCQSPAISTEHWEHRFIVLFLSKFCFGDPGCSNRDRNALAGQVAREFSDVISFDKW